MTNHFEVPAQQHDQLNPAIWDGQDLKPQVQLTLLRIAREYYRFLDLDIKIDDIVISGSQANYNYSPHSDLDLHLIVDYSQVECDLPVDELFKTKRDLWREEHQIHIYGIPVELYAEDRAKPATSSVYSIMDNRWIKRPEKIDNLDLDIAHIESVCTAWIRVITHSLRTRDIDAIERTKNLLWAYRRQGLRVHGEMGEPNVVFKALRNAGVTDQLLTALRGLKDHKLSLEGL